MTKKDKQYTIYIRSTKESIPVNKEEFDAYYHDINIYRIRQQRHGRCVCPASKRLTCDMDCLTCPFHRRGDMRSLDYTETDDEGNETAWVDEIPDDSPLLEDIIIEASEMKALYDEGFDIDQSHTDDEDEPCAVCISMPRSLFTDSNLENLKALIAAKGSLIKKALGVADLPLEITDTKVR